MTTETPTPTRRPSPSADPPAAEIFPLLADERRRIVIHYLTRQVGAVSVEDLADHLAFREGTRDEEAIERILINLHHSHLPRLADSGLVRFDRERKTVTGRATLEAVRPFLDLELQGDPQ